MKSTDYEHYSLQQLEQEFKTSLERGLSSQEARQRLDQKKVLTKLSKASPWLLMLRQLQSPLIYLLLAAALLSALVQDYLNAGVIIFIVLINALLSFYQEFRASKAAQLLQSYLVTHDKVLRDGQVQVIETSAIVPGDIIILEPGDAIPADIRFIQTENCMVDESALTGESIPLYKNADSKQKNEMLGLYGTYVIAGSAKALVLKSGKETVFGSIAELVSQTNSASTFNKDITRLSSFLMLLAVGMVLIILAVNMLFRGNTTSIVSLLLFGIALAVTITPEALPAVMTFALSRGAYLLAQRKVIVKRLSAVEDLGSINLLCIDKTGTITQNLLTVVEVNASKSIFNPLFIAALGTDERSNGFDAAIRKTLTQQEQELLTSYRLLHDWPFDPIVRSRTINVKNAEHNLIITKGAAEVVIPSFCGPDKDQQELFTWAQQQGQRGHRVIAVAYAKSNSLQRDTMPQHFDHIALIAFTDPLKKTAVSALQQAQNMGITIKILTGDSPDVAGAVAYDLGLIPSVDDVVTGLQFEKVTLTERKKLIQNYSVFARMLPQQKFEIIELLKPHYNVGFLGEGINDAPALKAAHVAIVVKDASDIAQHSADIILLNKSLNIIIQGVQLGRMVYANTFKYIRISLSSTVGNFFSMGIISFFIDYLPMLPLQLLLVNLLSDFPMIALATDSVDTRELRRPNSYTLSEIVLTMIVFGLISTLFDLIFFIIFHRIQPAFLQTNWFMSSLLTEIVIIYSLRSRVFFLKASRPSHALIALSLISLLLAIIMPFMPSAQKLLSFVTPVVSHVIIIFMLVLCYFAATEWIKVWYYRTNNNMKL